MTTYRIIQRLFEGFANKPKKALDPVFVKVTRDQIDEFDWIDEYCLAAEVDVRIGNVSCPCTVIVSPYGYTYVNVVTPYGILYCVAAPKAVVAKANQTLQLLRNTFNDMADFEARTRKIGFLFD